MTACSAHKTLNVMTGGAWLNIADERFVRDAKGAMALFGSTSPSYPIMASLDWCRAWLEDNGLQQNLTVEVLDPPLDLITGAAVILRDTGSGMSGLFWVDGDTHTWKNGQHFGKFKLNFRNLMG